MNTPLYCDIGITEECFFKCKMCKIWQIPKASDELSIEEWKEFIVSLDGFNCKDIRLHFAGGEPLLKKGMIEIIEFADNRGFSTVMVTNGFLVDKIMAEKIARSGLDVVSISLDSLNPEVHDFLRGQKGAYQRVMEAIDFLTKAGAKSISILALMTGYNLDSLAKLTEWVERDNRLSSIYFQAISQPIATTKDNQWYERDEYAFLWPSNASKRESLIGKLMEFKKNGYKISNSSHQLEMFKAYFSEPYRFRDGLKCHQGDYTVYIRPNGDVLLCGSMAPAGNVRSESIKNIWHSEEADLRRQEINNCKDNCLNVLNCFVDKELP